MQWSANKAVKLIESWGQHGTICTQPLPENWLHQSSRQKTSLRTRGGREKRKERKDEEAPSKKWGKKILCTGQSLLRSRRRTMVQPYSTVSPKI
ncbi:hypothetical protein PAHAL_7G315500 [Panicum hallii]|uniref:Uncharacterized protein n=1 Tax=Panicum hallii TaxID=206008 RepID=A0A2T8IE70_9POAL|nr:hypothetical protein PAHAL_7G315500 [Panicum hallii]